MSLMVSSVPILFIIFNKLEETKKVFEAIRLYKPAYLFIAADGARSHINGEIEKCSLVRAWVIDNIDWNCSVSTLFRDNNAGCGRGPSEAITWFFTHVEEGIILEDDCLPNKSFFEFCATLLDKYRTNTGVSAISGNNFQQSNRIKGVEDYYFSIFPSSWGWATWKRAWLEFDFTIKSWSKLHQKKFLKFLFTDAGHRLWWKNQFDSMYINQPQDMWDFQFHYLSMTRKQLAIIPRVNLVSNIGHGLHGTHFNDPNSSLANLPIYELTFPLRHPTNIARNYEADAYVQNLLFGRTETVSLYKRTTRAIKNTLRMNR